MLGFFLHGEAIADTSDGNLKSLRKTQEITYEYWLKNIADHTPPDWVEKDKKANWRPPLNTVTVGAHINSIHGLSHKLQAFEANVDFWATWKGKVKLWDGSEVKNPTSKFYFNSIRSFDMYQDVGADEDVYETEIGSSTDINVDGSFSSKFDYKRFPFDDQTLTLDLTIGNDAYEFQIISAGPPTVQTNYNKIMDYRVNEISLVNLINYFPTNFGVPDYAKGEYFANSGVRLLIKMERFFLNSFVDYIIPMFVISLLLLINQSRLTTDKGVKLALPPAALLSLIFLKEGADNTLPALNYLTYLDMLYLGSFFLIMLCFIEATIFKFVDGLSIEQTRKVNQCRAMLVISTWGIFLFWPVAAWLIITML